MQRGMRLPWQKWKLKRNEKEELHREVLLLQKTLQNSVPRGDEHASIKVPEPKAYNSMQGAKELKNFL